MTDSREPDELPRGQPQPKRFEAGNLEDEETYRTDAPASDSLGVGFAREDSRTVVTQFPDDGIDVDDETDGASAAGQGPDPSDPFQTRPTQVDVELGEIQNSDDIDTDLPSDPVAESPSGRTTAGAYQSVDDFPPFAEPPSLASQPSSEAAVVDTPAPTPAADPRAATAFFKLPDDEIEEEELPPPPVGFANHRGSETEIIMLSEDDASSVDDGRAPAPPAAAPRVAAPPVVAPPVVAPPVVAPPVAVAPVVAAPVAVAPVAAAPVAVAPVVAAPVVAAPIVAAPVVAAPVVAAPAAAPPVVAAPAAAPPVVAAPVAAPPVVAAPVVAEEAHREATAMRDAESEEEDIDMMRWKVVPTAWAAKVDEVSPPAPAASSPTPAELAAPAPRLQTVLWSEASEDAEEAPQQRVQSAFHSADANAGSQAFHLAAAYVEDALGYLDEITAALQHIDPDARRDAQGAVMAAGQKLRRAMDMLSPANDTGGEPPQSE